MKLSSEGLPSINLEMIMTCQKNSLCGLALALCMIAQSAFAASITIPPGSADTEGNWASCALCVPLRQQELYSARLFPSETITISEIRYRPDVTFGDAGPFSVLLSEIELRLSTSVSLPVNPDYVFANNVGPDEVVVYKGPWQFKTKNVGPLAGPRDFDIQLHLQKPFTYDPTKGNLLVDLRNFGMASRSYNQDGFISPGLVWATLIEDPLALRASGSGTSAAVMQIIYSPGIGMPVQASGVAQVVNGFVVGVALDNGGVGYTNVPAVRFFGGGGSGASATAVVSNGVVVSVTIDTVGRGYTNAPVVKIASPGGIPGLTLKTKRVALELSLVLGRRYRLDSSPDLITWTVVETMVAEDDRMVREFDVEQTGRYFRVVEVK